MKKNNVIKYEVLEYPCELHVVFEKYFKLSSKIMENVGDQVFEDVWDHVSNQVRVQTRNLIREEMIINDNIKY